MAGSECLDGRADRRDQRKLNMRCLPGSGSGRLPWLALGGMAERTNARLLKSRETQVSVGSNPTPSAGQGQFLDTTLRAEVEPDRNHAHRVRPAHHPVSPRPMTDSRPPEGPAVVVSSGLTAGQGPGVRSAYTAAKFRRRRNSRTPSAPPPMATAAKGRSSARGTSGVATGGTVVGVKETPRMTCA